MRILVLSALIGLSILCSITCPTNSTAANPTSVLSDSHAVLANAAHLQSSSTLRWSTRGFALTRSAGLGNTFNLSAPVAVNDFYTVHGGSQLMPLQNDSGQSLHIESFTQPAHGSVSPYSSSIISYNATYAYVGPDSFNYTVCNNQAECATATVTIDVVNQPPIAATDFYTVHGGVQVIPSSNDSDPNGDSISFHSIVTQPQHGSLAPYSNGSYTYGAHSGYTGSDSFTYKICDSKGACSIGTVNLNVVNQPPIAATDAYTVHGGVQVNPRSNDSDPDGDSITFHSIVTQPQHGSLAPYSNGIYTYGAHYAYTGPDSFTYRICDSLGLCSSGTVNLQVVNQAPVAVPDNYIVRGGIQVIPRSNDFDPDQDSLTAPAILTQPQHGGLSPYNTNIFNYGPYSGYTGSDSFTYRVCDGLGACSIGTVTLWVIGTGENDGTMSCSAVGEPVNVTNGNMYVQQSDYRLPGVGHSIEVTRTYNSNSQRLGLFGRGWTTSYDESIVAYDTNLARFNQPDGRAIYLGRGVGTSDALTPLEKDFRGSLVQNGSSGFTLTMKDGSIRQFDSAGKLISLVDRNNNTTSLTYSGNGFLSTVTDPFGRVLTLTTNANGQVLSISDTMGTIANYTYGSSNQLLSVTYPDNSAFQFTYNASFRLTSVIDALGNVLESHTYDSQGRALTSERQGGVERYTLAYASATRTDVTDALGHVTKYTIDKTKGRNVVTRVEGVCSCGGSGSQVQTWTYDNQLNLTAKTDALNYTTTFTYDANGNRLTEADPTGTVTYTYNPFGDVLTRTDQMNGTTTNTYDAKGNLLTTKDALNNTTTLTYDSHGQVLTITDPRSNATTFTYDTVGNLTRRTDALNNQTNVAYDARGRVTSITNALNQVTAYEHDLAGRLNKVIYPDSNFALFTYDLAGRRTKIKDPRGYETTLAYDAAYRVTSETNAGNNVTSYTYDLMSNLTGVTDALNRTTNYSYNDFNSLTKIKYPEASTGAGRLEENFTYDLAGNLITKTDQAGRVTTFCYDNVNRLTSTIDPAQKTTAFEYNSRSQQTAVVDAINQRYEFVYDALGRVTQENKGTATRSFSYDGAGNRAQRTDYNGAITNYSYDTLNRLTTISYPDTTAATYGYDGLSRLTTTTNPAGTVTIAYDSRGRMSSVTDVFGQVVSYAYDANSNRTQLSLNATTNATYQYDVINRLTTLTDGNTLNTAFAYDATNKVTSRSAPNGITMSEEYDGLDRLTRLKYQLGTTTLADYQYAFNAVNNIIQMTDSGGAHNYSYDTRDRLTAATHPNQTNESYTFDDVGNRTASHQGPSYNYQSFNRLVTANSATFSYDDNGNLISKSDPGGSWTYGWDSENRLKQAALSGGVTITYAYDALGRRVERSTSSGSVKKFIYDGADVVRELDANLTVDVDYLNGLGIDDKLQQSSGGTTVYYLLDHLGSTGALTDNNGNIVSSFGYDSFGSVSGGTGPTGYGYTGREMDGDTSLMYYRARWYDPHQGRFLSMDPIGFRGGDINLYAYVLNNPANFRDPTGTQRSDRDRPGDVEWARGLKKAIDRMPQPAPSGCVGAAWGPLGAVGDFWGNYNDMRGANTIGADKFFHCMANCEAARRGRSGRLVASGISEFREFFDEYIKGDPRSACNADRYANNVGRAGGTACRPCSQVCGGFKPNGLVFPVPRPVRKPVDWGSRSWGGGARGW